MIEVTEPLQLDLSGKLDANYIQNEPLVLPEVSWHPIRILGVAHGRFYTHTFQLATAEGTVLTRGTDYKLSSFDAVKSLDSGLEICSVIQILNRELTGTLYVSYRAFGGGYLPYNENLLTAIAAINDQSTKIHFSQLIDVPTTFATTDHQHQWYDMYSMNDMYDGLIAIEKSIRQGRFPYYDNLIAGYKAEIANQVSDLSAILNQLDNHRANKENPHGQNKAQLGYGNLPSLPPSTDQQVSDRSDSSLIMVDQVKYTLDTTEAVTVRAHDNDHNNPHGTNAHQLSSITRGEYRSLLNGYVTRGDKIANALTLKSKQVSTLQSEMNTDIPASAITSGVFDPQRIARGTPSSTAVLTGDGNWRELSSIFDEYRNDGQAWAMHWWPNNFFDGYTKTIEDCAAIITSTYEQYRQVWPIGSFIVWPFVRALRSSNRQKGVALRLISEIRVTLINENREWVTA